MDKLQYTLPTDSPVCLLDCKTAFEALTDKEKLYAHYLAKASWCGSMICLLQTSPESTGIFLLLQKLFRAQTIEEMKTVATDVGFSDDEFKAFLVYAAGFYSNMGNYKSFGDTKFIPNVDKEKMDKFIAKSKAYQEDSEVPKIWEQVKDLMISLTDQQKQLGLGQKGISTYYSGNCDMKDAQITQEFMKQKDLSAYNTRLFKTKEGDRTVYEIRLASAETSGQGEGDLGIMGTHNFTPKDSSEEVTFKVTRGDYSLLMRQMANFLGKAKDHVANESEEKMLEQYIRSFTEGSIDAHKDGSRHWIRNKGPIVETYIGFIESYRDPFGMRGEFEGFVAMVNKEMSAKFAELVSRAEHFLPLLPWPASYEKDKFLQPDFTSLEVLAFGSSGVPAGINIPNYDDIRQDKGFKNVSLGNVLAAGYTDSKDKITFLKDGDKDLFSKLKIPSFEVQVGLHELLGHGSGKLFIKEADGTFNFDTENLKHTETGEKITTWYEHNETWDSKFQVISSSYEECRAECVGIYLCLSSEIVGIFGHHGDDADDIIYVNWLNMVRAGLLALEYYTPEKNMWRQAHMQARFVILRVLIEAGEGLVNVEKVMGSDGEPDIIITLERSLINTVGKHAIGDFLRKLQVYKSTADYKHGKELYDKYSDVNQHDPPHFLSLRNIVLKRKQPRKMLVQCNTKCEDDKVTLTSYDPSPEGVIQSMVDRFPCSRLEAVLQDLWKADLAYF